jgi:hypothetical protein
MRCGHRFQGKKQPQRKHVSLWKSYVWGKQSLAQLSLKSRRSIPWVQRSLDTVSLPSPYLPPQPLVLIADVTYFSKQDGCLVVRAPHQSENIFWQLTTGESPTLYQEARYALEKQGYTFQAIVLDGRRGVREVFADIPVQMCHFHQKAILRRYLTLRPKLVAGQELLAIGRTLTFVSGKDFATLLEEWYGRFEFFLKERTFLEDGKHWHYTHKKIRSAYRSLITNLPYLFTFEHYPQLHIPNTTNSLDGFFSALKRILRVHSGLSQRRRNRVIQEVLFGKNLASQTKKNTPKD